MAAGVPDTTKWVERAYEDYQTLIKDAKALGIVRNADAPENVATLLRREGEITKIWQSRMAPTGVFDPSAPAMAIYEGIRNTFLEKRVEVLQAIGQAGVERKPGLKTIAVANAKQLEIAQRAAAVDSLIAPPETVTLARVAAGKILDKLVDLFMDSKFDPWRRSQIGAWLHGEKFSVHWNGGEMMQGCVTQYQDADAMKQQARTRHLDNLVRMLVHPEYLKLRLITGMPERLRKENCDIVDPGKFDQERCKYLLAYQTAQGCDAFNKIVADFVFALEEGVEEGTLGIVSIVENLSITGELGALALGMSKETVASFGLDPAARRPTTIVNMPGNYLDKLSQTEVDFSDKNFNDVSGNFFLDQFKYYAYAGVSDSKKIVLPLHDLVDEIHRQIQNGESVCVHCRQGRSRSATVVIAYLIKYYHLSCDDAMVYFATRRGIYVWQSGDQFHGIVPNEGFQHQLRVFENECRAAEMKEVLLQQVAEQKARREQAAAAEQQRRLALQAEEAAQPVVVTLAPAAAPVFAAPPPQEEHHIFRSQWNVGYGNAVFVRGSSVDGSPCNLSWDKGLEMLYDDAQGGWVLPVPVTGAIVYKFLKNDKEWEPTEVNHTYDPRS